MEEGKYEVLDEKRQHNYREMYYMYGAEY